MFWMSKMLRAEDKTGLSNRFLRMFLAGGVIFVIGLIVWQISNVACAIAMLEGGNLLAIFLTGLAIGYVPVGLLAKDLSRQKKIVSSLALGCGLLSLIVLFGGLAGLIRFHWVWKGFVWICGIIGAILIYVNLDGAEKTDSRADDDTKIVFESGKYWRILLILAVPFLILTILCVTIPPGVLWSAEGCGYDVLEYHLQVPKEWLEAGRIYHLPYNVYSNFPFNAEMLYLLAMLLKGSPFEAVYLSQMIHFGFAILFVWAIWAFTRDFGVKASSVSTISAATCSWVMYLAPLAYNELGMIFTGATAFGLILHCWRKESVKIARYSLLIGFILGISSGFKYTSVAMIFAPLILFFFVVSMLRTKFHKAILASVLMFVGWGIMFCPYLVRNYVWTGNPVFPLAYRYFDGSDFDESLAFRWERGHSAKLGVEESDFWDKIRNIKLRLERLYWEGFRNEIVDNFIAETYHTKGEFEKANEILNPPGILDLPKYGLAILVLPWLIFFTRRQGLIDWLMLFVFLVQTFVWMFFTHLQGRFLIVWLVVLPFMIARLCSYVSEKKLSFGNIFVLVVILLSFGLNFNDCLRRYVKHCYTQEGHPINWFGGHEAFLEGKVPGYEYLSVINENSSAKAMLIAEAKPFYCRCKTLYWTIFNRNDFAEHAKGPLHKLKDYMASVKPDFVFVNWAEARRLADTYGFPKSIRPKIFYYLSSPPRFRVRRIGHWGSIIRFDDRPVPARVLYKITYTNGHK